MTDGSNSGVRLDQYVTTELSPISRSLAAKHIESGHVSVNGTVITKSSYKLKPSDKIMISNLPSEVHQQVAKPIEIIYEDKHCVVINKPEGILSHSKGSFNPEGTVATWLSEHGGNISGDRAGIVHRLDRATSGVMICAKTPEALQWLQKQFSQRKVKKQYCAVVRGEVSPTHAVIEMPIERNPKRPQTFRVGNMGKPAITDYEVVDSARGYNLLRLTPTTGRTHQLRVHMKQIGHPIVGDSLYGGDEADRMYLHAERLELTLPNKKRCTFVAAVPKNFYDWLKK